jgi:hypothetical protein
MSIVIKHCDELLAKHHRLVSPLVLSVFAISVLGFIMPTVIYAAELSTITSTIPGQGVPPEFRPERRYEFAAGVTSTNRMLPPSSTIGQLERERAEAMKQVMQEFRNKRVATLKEKLLQLENAARDLRLKLEELQTSNPSSTPQVAIEAVNKELNDLLQVFRKTNFANEIPKLKIEVKKEYDLRKQVLKKELESQREAAKQQMEADREAAKQQFEANREAEKQRLEREGEGRPMNPASGSPQ